MLQLIIAGNPVDGFSYIGPFPIDADLDAITDEIDEHWWITNLVTVEEYNNHFYPFGFQVQPNVVNINEEDE